MGPFPFPHQTRTYRCEGVKARGMRCTINRSGVRDRDEKHWSAPEPVVVSHTIIYGRHRRNSPVCAPLIRELCVARALEDLDRFSSYISKHDKAGPIGDGNSR